MLFVLLLTSAHADDDAVLKALSVRDPEPPCAAVAALTPDPAASLERIAETVELPPWAPMRAARCLVAEHAEAGEAAFLRWVVDPERAGLGELVLHRTRTLPEPVAAHVLERALLGDLREPALDAISADARATVRTLAPDPDPVPPPTTR